MAQPLKAKLLTKKKNKKNQMMLAISTFQKYFF